ncbi:MAG: purine nucleoside permease [Cyanobacteria bacterium P01_F01_bin.42]
MKFIPSSLVVMAALISQGIAAGEARPTDQSNPDLSSFKLSQILTPQPAPQPSTISPSTPGASQDLYFLARAKNLARQAAVLENGGLSLYRPELSMFGPALQSPFQRNEDGSVTFRFQGGMPGATLLDRETEVLVDAGAGVTVVYNGPVRGGIGGASLQDPDDSTLAILDESSFLARARNLARQAGVATNGGLDEYRPEASMFGPTSRAPFKKNSDGSVTFTFQGGAPLAQVPTVETAVTVTKAGTVTVDYNRSIQN